MNLNIWRHKHIKLWQYIPYKLLPSWESVQYFTLVDVISYPTHEAKAQKDTVCHCFYHLSNSYNLDQI